MDTTNKKTCTFMLDNAVAAEVDRLADQQMISKSALVNRILTQILLPPGYKPPAPGKPGPKPKKVKR